MVTRLGGASPLTYRGCLCILPRLQSLPRKCIGMTRFLEFLVNHWILSGLWAALFATLMFYVNAKSGKSVSPQQATLLVNKHNGIFLDIRERKDFEKGHIVDAINIPLAKLHERITELDKKKESPIVVVCQMGQQSGEAVKALEAKGFVQVTRMSGGMNEWQLQNLPVVK
jgi:rhodanese-related sulfurtransferase